LNGSVRRFVENVDSGEPLGRSSSDVASNDDSKSCDKKDQSGLAKNERTRLSKVERRRLTTSVNLGERNSVHLVGKDNFVEVGHDLPVGYRDGVVEHVVWSRERETRRGGQFAVASNVVNFETLSEVGGFKAYSF